MGVKSRKTRFVISLRFGILGLQLKPTRIKGSHYLLIPKDLAELLEISDHSILNLTIEDTDKGQRLIYSVLQDQAQVGT